MRWVVALAVLLAAARPAAAKPKIPKALEGVTLHERGSPDVNGFYTFETYELVSLKVDSKMKRLGERPVVEFVHRYKVGYQGRKGGAVAEAELAIVDAETMEYVFSAIVEARGWKYDWSWPDLDGDGEKELELELVEGTSDAVFWPAHRVLQVRYGAFVDVSEEGAKCGRSGDDRVELRADPDVALRRAAADRLRADLDYGVTTGTLHCDLIDAIVATPESVRNGRPPAWPELGVPIVTSPVALDCPALGWAERHGIVVEPRRVGTFITTDRRIALFAIDERGVVSWTLDWSPEITWSQTWILDDRLYLFAEAQEGAGRTALVLDVVTGTTRLDGPLKDGEVPVVELATADAKTVSFVAAGAVEKRTLWSRWVRTWTM
jgi:hypothetical protein